MPARLLENSCLVNLPAKLWTARNLKVQRVLTCRLLTLWLLSNPSSHVNLGKQARKAATELGTPRATGSSVTGQRVTRIAPELRFLAFPRGFLDLSGLDSMLKCECIANLSVTEGSCSRSSSIHSRAADLCAQGVFLRQGNTRAVERPAGSRPLS